MTSDKLEVRKASGRVIIGRPTSEARLARLAQQQNVTLPEQIEELQLRQQRLERLLVRIAEHLGIDP